MTGEPKKKKVSKTVKDYVQKAINASQENKFYNNANVIASGTTCDNGGVIGLLSNINQGTTLNSRIGMTIRPVKLDLRWQSVAFSASANNVNPTFLRIIILQVKQAAATAVVPTPAQVLESVGSNIYTCSGYDDVTSSTRQYKILYDKTVCMDNGVGQQSFGHVVINRNDMNNIHYLGANGVDVSHGNLYILYGSDLAVASAPSLTYSWQIEYEDA